MVKSSSLILIGTGIFIFYVNMVLITYSAVVFTDDPTILNQIWNIRHSGFSLDVISENSDGLTMMLMILLGFTGMTFGFLLLFIGGIKLVNEKRKSQENIPEQKRVSIVWQVIGSMIPGFDLWVLYRIKKLRLGSIVYALQYAFGFVLVFSDGVYENPENGILITIGYAAVVFIWSRKWNEQFLENNIDEEIK